MNSQFLVSPLLIFRLIPAWRLVGIGVVSYVAAFSAAFAGDSQPWYEKTVELPSTAGSYGVAPGILLTADATDASPGGTIPSPTVNNKPGIALPNVNIQLNEIRVTAKRIKDIGPMPGLNLTKEQIPGNIQSISAKEIKDSQSLSITDLLNSKLQSVNVNDYQGNPFQMDLTYRGFTAGPQIGSQQGLSVFLDGIRVNEPFGDVVNWDMIPMNAISSLDVIPGSNPLYGLNTLGGAIAIKTKSGFDSPGVSAQVLKGSYGRDQLVGSAGWNNGTLAAFGAVNLFMEDGWRDNSPSKVNQAFGKIDWQGEQASLSFSTLAVVNKLVGNGTVPTELYKQSPTSVFTSPDETRNRLLQFQISGAFEVSDTFNITGMVYDRSSKRISSTGDIIDLETFQDLGRATRRANPGEAVSCMFVDSDGDGFPNYYLDRLTQDAFGNYSSAFLDDVNAHIGEIAAGTYTPNYALLTSSNTGLPAEYIQYALQNIKTLSNGNVVTDVDGQQMYFNADTGPTSFFTSEAESALYSSIMGGSYFTVKEGTEYVRYNVIAAPAVNQDCYSKALDGNRTKLYTVDADGNATVIYRDGANQNQGQGSGYIQGTPTAVVTNSVIDQKGQGFATQFNWNLDNHKFMVGLALDKAGADYKATQRFGLLDNQRNVYSDPDNIGEEYYAGGHDVLVNAFDGTKTTKSIYFSETWTPTQTLNLSLSGRYNDTFIKNSLAPKAKYSDLTDYNLLNHFFPYVMCTGTDPSTCTYDPSKAVSVEEWKKLTGGTFVPLGSEITEKFTYYSFNPAIGATWQTTPRLNMYFNWNQGTRTPSVIELGCAYDDTIVPLIDPVSGNPIPGWTGPRSLIDGRSCSLPNVMSGDPYLPQVMAQTYEAGVRGKFKDLLEWNLTAYRTSLRDDLYLVAPTSQLSFFQDIGDTQRQGIEFGMQGAYGKHEFRANYSLTEATFQSLFRMVSPNNSAIIGRLNNDVGSYNMIQVEPGDRMPGVPLNNLNLSWMYKVTPAFKVGLTMVAHSDAFVRGNENNEHTPGPNPGYYKNVLDEATGTITQVLVPGAPYRTSGKTAGYAVFNFRATYDMGKGWSAGMLVNNLLDKEYVTAGRLGLNPFAPSIYGAIGAGGFNYNSSEWLSTQFISGGAPRGVWFTLGYDFDASKKSQPPQPTSTIPPEPDRTLEPSKPKTAQELALAQALDSTRPLPVIKRDIVQSANILKEAEQQVASAVEKWRAALASGDTVAYLGAYSHQYTPAGIDRHTWEEQRKTQLAIENPARDVRVDSLVVAPQGKGMSAIFVQREQGRQPIKKFIELEQQNGNWLITSEHELKTPVKDNVSVLSPAYDSNNQERVRNIRIVSMKKEDK